MTATYLNNTIYISFIDGTRWNISANFIRDHCRYDDKVIRRKVAPLCTKREQNAIIWLCHRYHQIL